MLFYFLARQRSFSFLLGVKRLPLAGIVWYICVCFSVEKFITSSKVEYSYPYVTYVTYVTFDFSEQMTALIQRQFSAGQDLPHHVSGTQI